MVQTSHNVIFFLPDERAQGLPRQPPIGVGPAMSKGGMWAAWKKKELPETHTSLEACLLIGCEIWVPHFPFQHEESNPAGALASSTGH